MALDQVYLDAIDQLNQKLHISRQRFDEWANRQTADTQRLFDDHKRAVLKERENIEKRQKKAALLRQETDNNKKVHEKRKAVIRSIEAEIEELRAREQDLLELNTQLDSRIADIQESVVQQRRACASVTRLAEADHVGEVDAFSRWLGLRFERTVSNGVAGLRLVFTNISLENPDREYVAELQIRKHGAHDGGEYIPGTCNPPIPNISDYCAEANSTKDFGKLVRSIRKSFMATAISNQ